MMQALATITYGRMMRSAASRRCLSRHASSRRQHEKQVRGLQRKRQRQQHQALGDLGMLKLAAAAGQGPRAQQKQQLMDRAAAG
jgi:hypothetical protein